MKQFILPAYVWKRVSLTGIVCPPCKVLMAACASVWLENLTKAQPAKMTRETDREARHQGGGLGYGQKPPVITAVFSCYLVCKCILPFVCSLHNWIINCSESIHSVAHPASLQFLLLLHSGALRQGIYYSELFVIINLFNIYTLWFVCSHSWKRLWWQRRGIIICLSNQIFARIKFQIGGFAQGALKSSSICCVVNARKEKST